jgi:hypothetical protein
MGVGSICFSLPRVHAETTLWHSAGTGRICFRQRRAKDR